MLPRKPLRVSASTQDVKFEIGTEHIYLNASIPPNRPFVAGAARYEAKLTDRRNESILDSPEDYFMSIVRFSCPSQLIPICFMGIYEGISGTSPTTNINLTNYAVVIEFAGFQAQVGLIWTPENPTIVPPVAPPVIDQAFVAANVDYYSMFSYNTFIKMMNTAMATAFTNISDVENWPAAATLPPYFTLDETTGMVSLWAQTAYDSTVETPIKLFFNAELMEFFQSTFETIYNGFHPISYATGSIMDDWQLVIRNRGNNYVTNVPNNPIPVTLAATGTTTSNVLTLASTTGLVVGQSVTGPGIPAGTILVSFVANTSATLSENLTLASSPLTAPYTFTAEIQPGYRMSQEFAALINWTDFTNITFLTGGLPVSNEYSSLVYSDLSVAPTGKMPGAGLRKAGDPIWEPIPTTQTSAGVTPIVTDFVPSSSGSGTDLRTFITYVPTSEYRLSDLVSGKGLNIIDLQVMWGDSLGNLFPVYVTHNCGVSVKIMFRKKSYGGGGEALSHTVHSHGPKNAHVNLRGGCSTCATGGCASCGGRKMLASG